MIALARLQIPEFSVTELIATQLCFNSHLTTLVQYNQLDMKKKLEMINSVAVSYTHLTLPTKLEV